MIEKRTIYLDNSSTTFLIEDVLNKMLPFFTENYANPSSTHFMGKEANKYLENSRKIISESIGAKENEIIFTSGATESNNMAILGIALKEKERRRIIVSPIEHPSVIKPIEYLKEYGFLIEKLKVDKDGFIDLEDFQRKIDKNTFLVSVNCANHEIGTTQDIKRISKICNNFGCLFHSDMADGYTKIQIDVKDLGIDLMTLSSHKIHGPKGVGALFIKEGVSLKKIYNGAPQESGRRSGVENLPGIIGFAEASRIAMKNFDSRIEKTSFLRDRLIKGIFNIGFKVHLNGPADLKKRLPYNVNIGFEGVQSHFLLKELSDVGICVSSGSAYYSKFGIKSPILSALGFEGNNLENAVRFSVSSFNTIEEIDYVVKQLSIILNKI